MSDRIGRNQPCPCGSEVKYKKCCLIKRQEYIQQQQEIRRIIDEQKNETEKEEKKITQVGVGESHEHEEAGPAS